ncbi:MAG: DUF6298 domain-containing protein [Bacteroidales bacterium]
MLSFKQLIITCGLIIFLLYPDLSRGQTSAADAPAIVFSSDSMPPYHTLINAGGDPLGYSRDEMGNRVPDFSYCGYRASEVPIPDVPVRIMVPSVNGDATSLLQKAIDDVSSLEPDSNGFRGAVLLDRGNYRLKGSLFIRTSGVVLRGRGSGQDGTLLTGMGVGRETLIVVEGGDDSISMKEIPVSDDYYPLNTTELKFDDVHPFRAGDEVRVTRPSTSSWLQALGTDRLGVDDFRTRWDPGDFDLVWDRRVVEVTDRSVILDAPLTNALEPEYGRARVSGVTLSGRINNVGIENLRLISEFDPSNPKDENHRWMAISLDHLTDGWVRRVVAEQFVSSAVAVWADCRRITVEDCRSLSPVGEEGNYRRYAFQTLGQQVLFQRCYAERAYHAFSVGFTTPGPNAFVQCHSANPLQFSGAVGGWATGILFDKVIVNGGDISFGWRDMDGQGGGWSAANSLCWQCRAARVIIPSPPTAHNWAYGNWAQPQGDGIHGWPNTFLRPESLFYDQLGNRTGKRPDETDKILVYASSETTAPLPEMALRMSVRSRKPDLGMNEWIDSMIRKYPIVNDTTTAVIYNSSEVSRTPEPGDSVRRISIIGGRIVRDGMLVTGGRRYTALWRGNTRPSGIAEAGPHLTRFVPGRTGEGLTDDLLSLASGMSAQHVAALSHFPALWYERRRDDHERIRRSDADVWAPFYEQPFSRSGTGEAYDRLSKYDLDQWNPWYWSRLNEFAGLADQFGLLLIQEHYLQHNIIEEGAHWVDYPWRSANNINGLGFAEPPHYSGDKRVYMAGEFYDTTNERRSYYHRQYIRKSLENVKDHCNVIHDIGHEYTGPLHFMQFWLDEIGAWEEENGQDLMVMLQGTRDVEDAILADPDRSRIVDVIDIRQWHYREDGSLYAPEGGVSLAQRQYARIFEPGHTSFEQIYRAILEYRTRYPEKAVVSSLIGGGPIAEWAVFMAGGSLPDIPEIGDEAFLHLAAAATAMQYRSDSEGSYVLERDGEGYIVFSQTPEVDPGFCNAGYSYSVSWIEPLTGRIHAGQDILNVATSRQLRSPFEGPAVIWLQVL